MSKIFDENYWQVGDEVYCFFSRKKQQIVSVAHNMSGYPIATDCNSYTLNGVVSKNRDFQDLFHLGAIIFDEQDRPIAIDYDYLPKREMKVLATKLPHEFEVGEQVLVRESVSDIWCMRYFKELCNNSDRYECWQNSMKKRNFNWKYCIPYNGNEKLLQNISLCDSGKVPDGYVFPKKEYEFKPFDRVLVRHYTTNDWQVALFSHKGEIDGYYVVGGYFNMCIPYEGNEHLLGTNKEPN